MGKPDERVTRNMYETPGGNQLRSALYNLPIYVRRNTPDYSGEVVTLSATTFRSNLPEKTTRGWLNFTFAQRDLVRRDRERERHRSGGKGIEEKFRSVRVHVQAYRVSLTYS